MGPIQELDWNQSGPKLSTLLDLWIKNIDSIWIIVWLKNISFLVVENGFRKGTLVAFPKVGMDLTWFKIIDHTHRNCVGPNLVQKLKTAVHQLD